jgi:hypothetical protein
MALSSAELWHDVLQRLAEVQESQVILARAVAELGGMVKSLSDTLPALTAGSTIPLGIAAAQPGMKPLPLAEVDTRNLSGTHRSDGLARVAASEFDDHGDDLVGPLPDDVIAAFFPPEAEVLPWYKRRVSLRHRSRGTKSAPSTRDVDRSPVTSPLTQLLPPPPPQHLIDQYVMCVADPSAEASAPAPIQIQAPGAVAPEASGTQLETVMAPDAVAVTDPVTAPEPVAVTDPVTAPEPVAFTEPATAPQPVAIAEPLISLEPMELDAFHQAAAPALDPDAEAAPLVPRPLVYTPSNAETAMPLDVGAPLALDEPLAVAEPVAAPEPVAAEPPSPVAVPFELDPPQGLSVQSAAPAPTAIAEAATPSAAAESPAPPDATDEPEPALVGAVGGRPVVEAQMSVSMATEILGSAAAAAPPVPTASNGEPTPLVISEDLTLVSKHHRNRKRLQFRLR